MDPMIADAKYYEEVKELFAILLRDIAPKEVRHLDDSIAAVLRGDRANNQPAMVARSSDFIEAGVLSLHLIAGTLAVIESFKHRRRQREEREIERELQAVWQEELMKQGMSFELARQIPVKYCPDVVRFLMRQRLPGDSFSHAHGSSGETHNVTAESPQSTEGDQ